MQESKGELRAENKYNGTGAVSVVALTQFKSLLLNGYSSCPAFSQFDWLIIGQDGTILPDEFSC